MISVIIPVFNGQTELPDQLDAMSKQSYAHDWQLLIADNGSTDQSVAVARAWVDRIPGLQIVDASARRGIGAALNAGVGAACGSLLAFTDQDDIVAPGWLEGLARGLEDWDAVSGPMEFFTDRSQIRNAQATSSTSLSLYPFQFLPYALTCNLGVRRHVFESVGGFDETFESCDVDFCWRLQLAGYRLGFEDRSAMWKRRRDTPSGAFRQHFRYGTVDVRLFRRYGQKGLRRDWSNTAKTYAWLISRVPLLFLKPVRLSWVRVAGQSCGRVSGSLRLRVLYL